MMKLEHGLGVLIFYSLFENWQWKSAPKKHYRFLLHGCPSIKRKMENSAASQAVVSNFSGLTQRQVDAMATAPSPVFQTARPTIKQSTKTIRSGWGQREVQNFLYFCIFVGCRDMMSEKYVHLGLEWREISCGISLLNGREGLTFARDWARVGSVQRAIHPPLLLQPLHNPTSPLHRSIEINFETGKSSKKSHFRTTIGKAENLSFFQEFMVKYVT